MSGKSDKSSHFPKNQKYKKTKETGLGKSELFSVQMSGQSDTGTHHSQKRTDNTALGQSELFPVQMSGKSDLSTHTPNQKN